MWQVGARATASMVGRLVWTNAYKVRRVHARALSACYLATFTPAPCGGHMTAREGASQQIICEPAELLRQRLFDELHKVFLRFAKIYEGPLFSCFFLYCVSYFL
jgi:hypothetical protein